MSAYITRRSGKAEPPTPPFAGKVFGVSINLANSNPETAVTYTDDAVGMTGGSSAWDSQPIFKDIKPCVLKNGVVQYYLNPNNFAQKAEGGSADITSGNAGDVMIEFPKTGYQINTSGDTLTVKITDDPNREGFRYYAHTRVTEGDREKLYVSAYQGCVESNKLRSLSGKTPTSSQSIATFRTQAQANGTGYDLLSFYPVTLIQCLYLIRFKNLDSQSALGEGCTSGSVKNTGATNSNGMYYGSSSTTSQMKCFGIEDLWGNLWDFVEGCYSDASRNLLTAFQNFNDATSGYTNRGQLAASNIGSWSGGYMTKPQGTNERGFVLKEAGGSATTYFADTGTVQTSNFLIFGADAASGTKRAGVFHMRLDYSTAHGAIGSRLMYL